MLYQCNLKVNSNLLFHTTMRHHRWRYSVEKLLNGNELVCRVIEVAWTSDNNFVHYFIFILGSARRSQDMEI